MDVNEQNQGHLSSDINVDSDKAHPSEVHEHAKVESFIEKNQSSKDEDALIDIQKVVDVEKGGDDVPSNLNSQNHVRFEKQETNHGSQEKCPDTKKESEDLLESESSSSRQNTDNEKPQCICSICDEIGHKSLECPLLVEDDNFTEECDIKCFECHEIGHKKIECPLLKTGAVNKDVKQNKIDKQCILCLRIGHTSFHCPFMDNNKTNKNVRSHTCYNCRVIGHKISECPLLDTLLNGENNKGDQPKCLICNTIGHKSYQCPKKNKKKQNKDELIKCFKCLVRGHKISDCPLLDPNEYLPKCSVCNTVGHKSLDCPTKEKQDISEHSSHDSESDDGSLNDDVTDMKCYICNGIGHKSFECPNNKKKKQAKRQNLKCIKCRVIGHKMSECPLLDTNNEGEAPKCIVCDSIEHNSLECPTKEKQDASEHSSHDSDNDDGSSIDDWTEIKCFVCTGIGHTGQECLYQMKRLMRKRSASKALSDERPTQYPFHHKKMKPTKEVDDDDEECVCLICDAVGHKATRCPYKKIVIKKVGGRNVMCCYLCGKPGHKVSKCALRKTSSDRSRSRSPLQKFASLQGSFSSNPQILSPDCLYLFVGNLPPKWYVAKIKQFFIERCKSSALTQALKYITVIKDSNNKSKGECVMEFTSANACLIAMKAMRGAEVEGKKIIVMPDTGGILGLTKSENSSDTRNNTTPSSQQMPVNPEPMPEKHLTYGLSVAFLESLNIKPPLRSKIFVGNLDSHVTASMLRELFSNAGQVITVYLNKKTDDKVMAKIEFDHPVEAVQAISMFHDRKYFEKFMLVKMDENPNKIYLPPRLASIGPGLGTNGEPLRGIRHVVELEPIKQMLLQELSKIQSLKKKELEEDNNMTNNVPSQMDPGAALMNNMNYQQSMTGMNHPFGWMGQSVPGLGMLGQMQALQGLLQPNLGFATSISDLQGQMTPNVAQNFMGMAQNQMNAPQNQTNWTQSYVDASQNQMNVPQSQMNVLQNQMSQPNQNMFQNNLNVPQNQERQNQINAPSSQLANMTASQLINFSQNQLADSSQSQSQISRSAVQQSEWSTQNAAHSLSQSQSPISRSAVQQGEWSTQHAAQSLTVSQPKEKKYYDDSRSTHGESSKYSKDTVTKHSDSGSRRSEEKNAMTSSDMLVFKNLPPSVTGKALKSKMREVGELRYVEITGEGRAIVRFNEARDAALCLKLFDRSKVDGQTISVNYF